MYKECDIKHNLSSFHFALPKEQEQPRVTISFVLYNTINTIWEWNFYSGGLHFAQYFDNFTLNIYFELVVQALNLIIEYSSKECKKSGTWPIIRTIFWNISQAKLHLQQIDCFKSCVNTILLYNTSLVCHKFRPHILIIVNIVDWLAWFAIIKQWTLLNTNVIDWQVKTLSETCVVPVCKPLSGSSSSYGIW